MEESTLRALDGRCKGGGGFCMSHIVVFKERQCLMSINSPCPLSHLKVIMTHVDFKK